MARLPAHPWRSMLEAALSNPRARQVLVALPQRLSGSDDVPLALFAGVVWPDRQAALERQSPSGGWFHDPPYSWSLPPCSATEILFCGPRRQITAPMLQSALRRGIRQIEYATPDGPRRESIVAMLARRALDKLAQRAVRLHPGFEALCHPSLERATAVMLETAGAGGRFSPQARRIVFANYTLNLGGAERQIVNTLHGLRERGLGDLHLVCERRRDDTAFDVLAKALEARGVAIHELPGLPVGERRQPRLDALPLALRDDVAFWMAMLRQLRPTVLHAWQDATAIKAGLAGALLGIPRIVLAGRNRAPIHFQSWFPWMRPLYRALLRQPNVTLTNNSAAGARDYASWLAMPVERIPVVYNGLAPESLSPAAPDQVRALRDRFQLAPDAPIVGSIFRFNPEKDPDTWLATAAIVAQSRPDVFFLLVGDGPLLEPARHAACRHGIETRTIFAGEMADVRPALAAMAVFLLTSHEEGLPNVVIEAQAQGVPVVTTRAGGAPEAIVPGETGVVIDDRAPSAIAAAVLRYLEDPARAHEAGRRGRDWVVDRFALARMIDSTLSLYGPAATPLP